MYLVTNALMDDQFTPIAWKLFKVSVFYIILERKVITSAVLDSKEKISNFDLLSHKNFILLLYNRPPEFL